MNINFHRRILINPFTGTGCGYWPNVSHAQKLRQIETYKASSYFAAVHTYTPTTLCTLAECQAICKSFGVNSYPTSVWICVPQPPSNPSLNPFENLVVAIQQAGLSASLVPMGTGH